MTTRTCASEGHRPSRFMRCAAGVLLAALVFASPARAQSRPFMGTFTYSTAMPVGYASDFVDQFSWLGFMFEGDWFFSPQMSLGLATGWQEIYDESSGTYEIESGAYTGRTYRHLGIFPLLMRGRYWLGKEGTAFRPFVGGGLGTYRVRQTFDFGIFTTDETQWHFGLAPEVGVALVTARRLAWTFNARYNYAVKAGDYVGGEQAWAYWAFAFGVGYVP